MLFENIFQLTFAYNRIRSELFRFGLDSTSKFLSQPVFVVAFIFVRSWLNFLALERNWKEIIIYVIIYVIFKVRISDTFVGLR